MSSDSLIILKVYCFVSPSSDVTVNGISVSSSGKTVVNEIGFPLYGIVLIDAFTVAVSDSALILTGTCVRVLFTKILYSLSLIFSASSSGPPTLIYSTLFEVDLT